jgi:phage-related protein
VVLVIDDLHWAEVSRGGEGRHGLRVVSRAGRSEARGCESSQGFGSAGVLEIVEDSAAGTYRGVYTVRFGGIVYVLHCFQKKSRRGIATPKADLDLIKRRLLIASEDYRKRTTVKR